MATYKATRQLAQCDAAHIAGLVDGEGTIGLSRRHARERRQLVVSIANTEHQLLDFVLESVGAGKITRKRVVKSHHKPKLHFRYFQSSGARSVTADRTLSALLQSSPSRVGNCQLRKTHAQKW